MAKETSRDRIWTAAMKKRGEYRPADIVEEIGVGERTVRDCLNYMADRGYLERSGGEGREPVTFRSRLSAGGPETPEWVA